jgi:hypothetical protein
MRLEDAECRIDGGTREVYAEPAKRLDRIDGLIRGLSAVSSRSR